MVGRVLINSPAVRPSIQEEEGGGRKPVQRLNKGNDYIKKKEKTNKGILSALICRKNAGKIKKKRGRHSPPMLILSANFVSSSFLFSFQFNL